MVVCDKIIMLILMVEHHRFLILLRNWYEMNKFRFIDLFAGIGGFHQAMTKLGGECVFASEIDPFAIQTYKENYGIDSGANIRDVKAEDIPAHDVLCAGFPCQAFSKAGYQNGFADETKGTLFFEIERILKVHHTKYIILENVRNLVSHDNGNTWNTIYNHLVDVGYRLTKEPLIISPHQLGIPQLRERVVILGVYDPEHRNEPLEVCVPAKFTKEQNSIYTVVEESSNENKISEYEERVLQLWDDFYAGIKEKVIGFPIWYDWFKKEPPKSFPQWKAEFVRKNNELYQNNKAFIDEWERKNDYLKWCTPTHHKFEWQAGESISSVWEGLIQMRPSGIRVKKANCFPALVAMVQIPIIGRQRRRLTVREAARLQAFPEDFVPNANAQQAYKQFGNAVCVEVIRAAAEELFSKY